jgi:hypothetical protein
VDNQSARTHLLDRTSPKGEYFIGTCRLCGTHGLRMKQANERCANPTGVTAEQAILDAIAERHLIQTGLLPDEEIP